MTGPEAPSLGDQVVNHVVVVVGHVAETWRTCSVRAPRVGRCRTPARSRWAPAAAGGGLVDVAPALGGRAVLEPWPPPARSTCSAASKTVRVALCCQVSAEAGAVSLIPSRPSSDGCVFGDRCWCGAQRTRSRHDTPRPRARRSRARVTWAWVLMTLRGGLGKQTKLSSTGSSSEWWSQRTVPVRVVVTHGLRLVPGGLRQRHSEHDRRRESRTLFAVEVLLFHLSATASGRVTAFLWTAGTALCEVVALE